MDWNKIVKAIGDYHGIECCPVETMEEADAQLAELYAKERHTPQEEKPVCDTLNEEEPILILVSENKRLRAELAKKPPANAGMVETEFGEWLRIMSEKASYSDQRDLLRVVLRHYRESRPVKAPADEGLEIALKALRDISVPNSGGYGQIARDALDAIKERKI